MPSEKNDEASEDEQRSSDDALFRGGVYGRPHGDALYRISAAAAPPRLCARTAARAIYSTVAAPRETHVRLTRGGAASVAKSASGRINPG